MAAQKDITSWASKDGSFQRKPSVFRNTVSRDPKAQYPAEKGRYHLYVSLACPWATRALIVRKLKGLENFISLSIVHPHMNKLGWSFTGDGYEGQGSQDGKIANIIPDPHYNLSFIRELYFKVNPDYEGRFTVPVFYDTKTETIVNNESSEIIRFMNTEFNHLLDDKYKNIDLYPEHLRKEIDEINDWVYPTINNGVYRSGFATLEGPYLEAVTALHKSLARLEELLGTDKDYLVGGQLTEADIRLFVTLIRFDPVYVSHFKCADSIRHKYPNLNRYTKNLYWNNPAFKDSTDFDHIKIHYYTSHPQINPTRIVPHGPVPNIEK